MRIALRELRRRPSRFVTAAGILTLIALLLMFLGGLVDGLIGASTGAIRAQRGDFIVFSETSRESLLRSRIDPELREKVRAVDGVEEVGGIGIVQLGVRIPGKGPRDLADAALFGVEIAPKGVPEIPPDGQVYADEVLKEKGVEQGMTIELGPARSKVTVVGFVNDTSYLGQGGLWGSPATWRSVLAANRPGENLPAGTFQALLVRASSSAGDVGADIDRQSGVTSTLTLTDAANAIPGVKEQRGTINQIISVTIVIAIVVVALFFALLTVERTALYGVLKAIGAASRTLFAGIMLQALIVTLVASVIATALAVGAAAAIPPGSIPFTISAGRVISSVVLLVVAALIGCAFSLRRVLRVDPATAIGTGS
ncbi:MAG: FtsX-like permease family protein [Acidimicrobiia bacterium]